jgi:hypothetical protein
MCSRKTTETRKSVSFFTDPYPYVTLYVVCIGHAWRRICLNALAAGEQRFHGKVGASYEDYRCLYMILIM